MSRVWQFFDIQMAIFGGSVCEWEEICYMYSSTQNQIDDQPGMLEYHQKDFKNLLFFF